MDIRKDNNMYLYHYYDKKIGPFRNLSNFNKNEANKIL